MEETASGDQTARAVYRALFRPESIAVVGASDNLSKPGGKVLKNLIDHRYKGTLWAVNPTSAIVSGLPSFTSIDNLPAAPDLAIIAIPAPLVVSALEDLARKGTRAIIVLTAGFGEKGEEGRREEERMRGIADKAGMVLIGPNCSGFMTPHYSGKFAGIIPEMRPRSIDIISGSGATVDLIMEQAVQRGLSFCDVINVGNSAQTGVEDIVALYDENYGPDNSPILLLYLESLKKPGLLLHHLRQLSLKGCTVVGIKAGVGGAGARAAASHTGAMATDDVAVDALFRKGGVIRVRSKIEMVDVACVLTAIRGRLEGNRVCVITDAGGPGVMISDELERQGMELPVLKEKTKGLLKRFLPPESSLLNPVDCLPTRTASQMSEILRIIEQEESGNIDVIVAMVANPGMSENDEIYRVVFRAMDSCSIPVIPVLSSTTTCAALINDFTREGKCFFQDEVPLAAALGNAARRPRLWTAPDSLCGYDRDGLEKILPVSRRGAIGPAAARDILLRAGFRFPRQAEAFSKEGLAASCEKIGYPLAMKVIGPLHKSDLGGVKIGINGMEEALSAWDALMGIQDAAGVLIQEMIEGHEVIIGAHRTDDLGHLIMFGLGGIYAEAIKDVRFALSPLSKEEGLEMVKSISGYSILEGIRGVRGMSTDLLVESVQRLGRLVADFPDIKEVDINPLKGYGDRLFVVDARIIIE